jgi:hypothetical protein
MERIVANLEQTERVSSEAADVALQETRACDSGHLRAAHRLLQVRRMSFMHLSDNSDILGAFGASAAPASSAADLINGPEVLANLGVNVAPDEPAGGSLHENGGGLFQGLYE